MIGGKIGETRKTLAIIKEDRAMINLTLQPEKSKAYWPTQHHVSMKPLT